MQLDSSKSGYAFNEMLLILVKKASLERVKVKKGIELKNEGRRKMEEIRVWDMKRE